jgi:hypothetical protein
MSSPATPEPEMSVSASIDNLTAAIVSTAKPTPDAQKKSNRIEIWKLIISGITPVLVAILTIFVARIGHQQETLTNARVKSYDVVKEDLNRIHCFIKDVGTWKEETPETVIAYKRLIDRERYEEQGMWSPKTMAAYLAYMNAAFATQQGSGLDARINTTLSQKRNSPKWADDWPGKITNAVPDNYQKAYDDMYKAYFADLKN